MTEWDVGWKDFKFNIDHLDYELALYDNGSFYLEEKIFKQMTANYVGYFENNKPDWKNHEDIPEKVKSHIERYLKLMVFS